MKTLLLILILLSTYCSTCVAQHGDLSDPAERLDSIIIHGIPYVIHDLDYLSVDGLIHSGSRYKYDTVVVDRDGLDSLLMLLVLTPADTLCALYTAYYPYTQSARIVLRYYWQDGRRDTVVFGAWERYSINGSVWGLEHEDVGSRLATVFQYIPTKARVWELETWEDVFGTHYPH